jgi:DNA-binding PadR family transcriptional regulator
MAEEWRARWFYIELWYIIIRSMARKMTVGPASDPELLILSSLAGGSKHGYAIMQEIAAFAGVELGPGTLYTAITRLVDEGWIEPAEASGRQRPYRLTPGGLDYLRGQLEKMRQLASFGLRRLRTV